MSEQERFNLTVLVLLLLVTGYVIYSTMLTRGEIDNMHARVDGLLRIEGENYIARILRAPTDEAAEAAAREAT